MALLQSGTRIYGTANVDTQINVGGNVAINTSGFSVTGNATTIPTLAFYSNATAGVLTIGNSTSTSLPTLSLANSTGNVTVTPISVSVGTAGIANTLGFYHTGLVNAASYATGNVTTGTGGVLANVTTITVGNNTINTRITSAGLVVNGTAVIANNTGVYTTGSFTVGTYGSATAGFVANATVFATGNSTVNNFANSSTSYISGTLIANSSGSFNALNIGGVPAANVVLNYSTQSIAGLKTFSSNVTFSGAIVANGATGGAGQVLTTNGTGVYWSTVSSGGGGGGGGASVTVNSVAPLSPNIGDLWFNTVDGNLKIYYQSNGYYTWVDASLGSSPTYNVANNKQAIAFSLVFGGF